MNSNLTQNQENVFKRSSTNEIRHSFSNQGQNVNLSTSFVDSLENICFHYVSKNIKIVDSLVDFPEHIGEELFSHVENVGVLLAPSDESRKILKLFSDAYGDLMLSELTFYGSFLAVEHCFESTSAFLHLKKLDLSGCKLGDDHDMLEYISQLNCLTHLSLKDNALSEVALRKLTTVISMYERGPKLLQILDLSYNPDITDRSTKFISRFKHLEALNLTATKVQDCSLTELSSRLQLVATEVDPSVWNVAAECRGWAGNIVKRWMEEGKDKSTVQIKPSDKNPTSLFCKDRKLPRVEVAYSDTRWPSNVPTVTLAKTSLSNKNSSEVSERQFSSSNDSISNLSTVLNLSTKQKDCSR